MNLLIDTRLHVEWNLFANARERHRLPPEFAVSNMGRLADERGVQGGSRNASLASPLALMEYRLYALNKRGRIVGPPNIIQAETDQGAIAEAKRLRRNLDRELRQDARVVTMLKASMV